MNRLLDHLPELEVILWIVASIVAFAAFLIIFPTLVTLPFGAVRPTTQAVATPRPTLTPIATRTPALLAPSPKGQLVNPLPTTGPGEQAIGIPANNRRSGWFVAGEPEPHWGDRNLHAGTYRGQVFQSLLYFDLSALAPGSKISFAEVELVGLNRGNLGGEGQWKLSLLPFDFPSTWIGRPNAEFVGASVLGSVGQSLGPADLAEGQINQFVLSAAQRSQLEQALDSIGFVAFRIDGPTSGESLFTWDGGDRDPTLGLNPILRVVAVPGEFYMVTQTPVPMNVMTAAAALSTSTAQAERFGTPTLLPRKYATLPPDIPITETPTPGNAETATAQVAYVTAVAMTTGTFTPTPPNLATVTPTPTSTPTPPFLGLTRFTPAPTFTPKPEVSLVEYRGTPIPPETGLIGKIAFITDREGFQFPQAWVMDTDGTPLGKLTAQNYHRVAEVHDLFSPDRMYHLDVGKDSQNLWQVVKWDIAYGLFTPVVQESQGAKGIGAYHPAWSPDGSKIAFVSERTGYSEIYVLDRNTKNLKRLTNGSRPDPALGYPPYYKHPSWSPDGSKIVFFSDLGTRPDRNQIWIMDADGGNQRVLSGSPFSDWDPVWIKW